MTDINRLFNEEAEVFILAYIWKHGSITEPINKDYFFLKTSRFIFKVLTHYKGATAAIVRSEVTKSVKDETRQEHYFNLLEKIQVIKENSLTSKNAKYLYEDLKNFYESRKILQYVDKICERIVSNDISGAKIYGRDISVIGDRTTRLGGDYIKDFEERKEVMDAKINNPDEVGVPTGITKFDAKSAGVLYGEFGIVLGQVGVGKSVCLENFAINAWLSNLNIKNKGHNVLYISLEMAKHELQFRADARLTRILFNKFRTGNNFTDLDQNRWQNRVDQIKQDSDNYFYIEYMPHGCSVKDVEILADKIQDIYQKRLHLIIVDYLNIMGKGGDSRDWKYQTELAWGLKRLASEFNDGEGVAIWTANQIRDDAQNKSLLTYADTKYGRAISEAAPLMVGLVRTQDDYLNKELQFQVIKFRNSGTTAPIILRPNMDIALLHDEDMYTNKTLENF